MPTFINLQCTHCQTDFQRDLRGYNAQMKDNPNTVWFCGRNCRTLFNREDRRCLSCDKAFNVRKNDEKKFCSHSCGANNTNKQRQNLDPIERNCPGCGDLFITGPYTPSHTMCKICLEKSQKDSKRKQKIKQKENLKKPRFCECGNEIFVQSHKQCKICKPPTIRIAQKRSKNEISFANKCAERWNCSYNECLFNGWDADVLIKDLKIAILWNGIWHYSVVNFKDKPTSLRQIQSRDRLKIKQIIAIDWVPYIIKDLSRAKNEKVQKEFDLFLDYLEKDWFRQACVDFAKNDLHGDFHEWVKDNIDHQSKNVTVSTEN